MREGKIMGVWAGEPAVPHQPDIFQDSIVGRPSRHQRTAKDRGRENLLPANHGVTWSIYAHDPEGDDLEFFVGTDCYIYQPLLIPVDFEKTARETPEADANHVRDGRGFPNVPGMARQTSPRMSFFVALSALTGWR